MRVSIIFISSIEITFTFAINSSINNNKNNWFENGMLYLLPHPLTFLICKIHHVPVKKKSKIIIHEIYLKTYRLLCVVWFWFSLQY